MSMANKTIYIKDSNMEVWEKAQKMLGGESISSIITDCLRERVRASKTLDNVEAMKNLLAELNEEQNLSLELHPFWSPVILDANSLDVGYKLHQARATPDRIMSLIVDPFNFAPDGNLTPDARRQIKTEVMNFWNGSDTERHCVVRVGCLDILSRLQNLIGKQGLVKLANVGEVGFTFIAVHPAQSLPRSGDDAALQLAITQSEFTVQFDGEILVEGSNRKVISGLYISLIRGRY
jgi:hypothetical protein